MGRLSFCIGPAAALAERAEAEEALDRRGCRDHPLIGAAIRFRTKDIQGRQQGDANEGPPEAALPVPGGLSRGRVKARRLAAADGCGPRGSALAHAGSAVQSRGRQPAVRTSPDGLRRMDSQQSAAPWRRSHIVRRTCAVFTSAVAPRGAGSNAAQ